MDEDSSPRVQLLAGGSAQRIEVAGDVALLRVRVRAATWLLLLSSRTPRGLGLLHRDAEARARGLLGEGATRARPAVVLGLEDTGVWLARGETVVRLGVPDREGPIKDGESLEDRLAKLAEGATWQSTLTTATETEWTDRGEALLEALEGSTVDRARRALLARIGRADARLARRAGAVEQDLAHGDDAVGAADRARLFVALAAKAPRGTKELVATDWSSGEAVPCTMELDVAKHPREQVEALFARARRLKRGAVVARQRLAETADKRARLRALGEQAVAATSVAELTAAVDAAGKADPMLLPNAAPARRGSAPAVAPRLSYRTFLSPSGARLLVGRGAADNDELTLHIARPHDLWLHAQGQPGAHVVVPLAKGHEAPADLLVDAAHLAAHFSDARGEAIVDVTYAHRRYVRKPRGSAPGAVTVDREKNIAVRIDPLRLAALLAREEV